MAELMTLRVEDIQVVETYEYEGVSLPLDVLRSTMDELKTFDIRQDDVFVVTFPKAGTTWTQEIVSAILHDGDLETLNKSHTWNRAPFLEMTFGGFANRDLPRIHKMLENLPRSFPRLMKSHLPGQLLPPQVWEKKTKIVYVIRNPKDVVVSYFHHCEVVAPHMNVQFEDAFNKFMDGKVIYGHWWEHYLYFWERRNEEHILFLRFEDAKKDLRGTVKRISEFLGKSFSDDILDAITDHCSFDGMKKNCMSNPDTILKVMNGGEMPQGKSFLRKGTVGDWKTHLSETQSEALNIVCQEKLKGTGLSFNM